MGKEKFLPHPFAPPLQPLIMTRGTESAGTTGEHQEVFRVAVRAADVGELATRIAAVAVALNALAANAAYALRRHDSVGSLEVGKKMDMLLCDEADYPSVLYELGWKPVRRIIKSGQVVIRDGQYV
jgi:cytosine/adenosine deaminase-related metal-dependent hydrolase